MADESRIVKDPICGKDVDTLRARAVGIFGGVTYYFCSADCKAKYRDPRQQAGRGDWSGVERRAEVRPPAKPAVPTVVAPAAAPAAPAAAAGAPSVERGANAKVEGKPAPPPAAAGLAVVEEPRPVRAAPVEDAALDVPARRGVPWLAVVLTLLMAAGAVLLFTLRK